MEKTVQHTYGQPGSMEFILRSQIARSQGGLVKMSPGTAKRILGELNFPGQRGIDTSRVYSHARNIVKGDWIESFGIDFVALPDGRIWLVDGQHRLTAISEQEGPASITIRLIEVDSEKDARRVYAGYDQKRSVRTNTQIIDALGLSEETGLSRNMATSVFEAASIIMNNMEPITGSANTKKNPELFLQNNKVAIVQEWAKEARLYEAIVKKAKKALLVKLRSTGMVAVALYTLRHQPSKAIEFWTGVAENDGLRKNDPRATLVYDILSRSLVSGSIRQKVQQPAVAWNAWCEGRNLSIIKCATENAITLWGTPIAASKRTSK